MSSKILCFIIDDDIDDQEIFSLVLKDINNQAECVMANDGIEGLQKLAVESSFTPNYIFLDLNMPRMNGKECLGEIRKIERLKNIPVIVYSTSVLQKDMVETRLLGATDYLPKQNSIALMKEQLKNVIEKYKGYKAG